MKKVTRTTFKSFIRNNRNSLLVRVTYKHDDQYNPNDYTPKAEFAPATPARNVFEENFGIEGIWCVNGTGRSGDRYEWFENDTYKGIGVNNCCTRFQVAVKK